MDQISQYHHFIPEWYQRGFLPNGKGNFYVLDKDPITAVHCNDGVTRKINPTTINRRGPNALFKKKGLYSIALQGIRNDAIETFVFGKIDTIGAVTNQMFLEWPRPFNRHLEDQEPYFHKKYGHPGDRMAKLLEFINVQKSRTPRGIAQIKSSFARSGLIGISNNKIMPFLFAQRNDNCTVWSEAQWEMFEAAEGTRFLLSDDPVIFYNLDCFPQSPVCKYPNEPNPHWRGTRVIYPLSKKLLLVLTHSEHEDEPNRKKARNFRRNARSSGDAFLMYTEIENRRVLSAEETRSVNYIIKKRAIRHVASYVEEDLYPEQSLATPRWPDLDKIFYPEFPTFHSKTETFMEHKDGSLMYTNAFGEHEYIPKEFRNKK